MKISTSEEPVLVKECRARGRRGGGKTSEGEVEREDIKKHTKKQQEKKQPVRASNGNSSSSGSKKGNQDKLMKLLMDHLECPVCLEIPRSGPVPVCPNGHFVCKTCKVHFQNCPTCQTTMGSGGRSLLAAAILENIEHKCNNDGCDQQFVLKDLKKHEENCLYRVVCCPDGSCHRRNIPLIRLVDHLYKSGHSEDKKPLETDLRWNRINFTITFDLSEKSMTCPKRVFSYAGQVFAVFPSKSDGQFYFVLVMFASESKCSQFKFEMVVHDRDSDASDSNRAVKFQGSPISVDVKKEDLNLYATSEKLMTKILKTKPVVSRVHTFSLSFKISSRI